MRMRALSPQTNAPGLLAAAAAVYAAVATFYNWQNSKTPIDWNVVFAAATAVAAAWTRGKVTPIADPKDITGAPLAPLVPQFRPAPQAVTEEFAAIPAAPVYPPPGAP